MKINIIRILGIRARKPVVIAGVDQYLVRWEPKEDWSCTCDEAEFPECPHIPAIENLLDPRVTGTKK
ncbi:hypothetical protein [Mycolicibacterium sp. OfavD-34-C]|uniref:hypothetical protein n=1 Tax=Mycolicibacterium sp. OfavD-34-C TaxID=2917746 RepID=UPI001EF62F50|nr:hypothetical protein [Mycolicibacterium sp. OfavD-34-C]MCG7582779.1 hypothetical protein [Mycolicibacterium sp. OfavD-34-C]